MSQHSISRIRRVVPLSRRAKLATASALTAAALGVGVVLSGPAFADTTKFGTGYASTEAEARDAAIADAESKCRDAGYTDVEITGTGVNPPNAEFEDYVGTARADCSSASGSGGEG